MQECTTTIIGEVESLKNLVDEFSQFARMPAPRAVAADLHQLLSDALALYDGLFTDVRFERRFDAELPQVRVDPEQMRRVIINLVDNAIEATDRRGTIAIETAHDPSNSLVRIVVADDGPGFRRRNARSCSAVLLDERTGQRARPRHRPAHRRRARRQHRGVEQRRAARGLRSNCRRERARDATGHGRPREKTARRGWVGRKPLWDHAIPDARREPGGE